jgi:transcription elongation factor B subunit 1
MAANMGTGVNQVPSKYITLVSADAFEFVVLREAAMVSPIIKGMLDVRSKLTVRTG